MGTAILPSDWTYTSVDRGLDESVAMHIKYVGSQASGTVTIAASTSDITFKHGAAGSETADTGIGTAGVVDLSADVSDFQSLVRLINQSDNWEAWLEAALPDDSPNSGATGYLLAVTGAAAKVTNGYEVKYDTSAVLIAAAGITFNGPSSAPHGFDAGSYNEILRVIASSTYASGTSTLKIYSCDDVAGTSTEVYSLTAGATTVEVAYPAETSPVDVPLVGINDQRLVVKLTNSAAMTAVRLKIAGRGYQGGPGLRKSKMMSNY